MKEMTGGKNDLPEIKIDFSKFPKAKTVALVTDSNVDRLYGDAAVRRLEESTGLRIERIVFPAGERSKTMEEKLRQLAGERTVTEERREDGDEHGFERGGGAGRADDAGRD